MLKSNNNLLDNNKTFKSYPLNKKIKKIKALLNLISPKKKHFFVLLRLRVIGCIAYIGL